jgi:hypothetical protein
VRWPLFFQCPVFKKCICWYIQCLISSHEQLVMDGPPRMGLCRWLTTLHHEKQHVTKLYTGVWTRTFSMEPPKGCGHWNGRNL